MNTYSIANTTTRQWILIAVRKKILIIFSYLMIMFQSMSGIDLYLMDMVYFDKIQPFYIRTGWSGFMSMRFHQSLCVCALLSLLFISACAPIYKTQYSYTPPHSKIGVMCVAQCMQTKSLCEQMCQLRNDNCRMQARQEAFIRYEEYKHERIRQGLPVDTDIGFFDNSAIICQSSCDCVSAFNTCYSACGGTIREHEVCTAFCNAQ